MQAHSKATLEAAAEYGYAVVRREKACDALNRADGDTTVMTWEALNADLVAAQAWVRVKMAALEAALDRDPLVKARA